MKLSFANFSLDSLSERDQRTLKIGGGIAALLLVYVIIQLDSSVASAHKRLVKKQDDLSWMRNNGAELAAATSQLSSGANGQSLLVVVDSSARESGLTITGSDPAGPGALNIRLQKVSFNTLIAWIGRLGQTNGIRVDNASIETAGTPGQVNASFVLRTD
jgi:type II secretory pathway component PulM